ncbi:MAG: hypothetical protein WC551_08130 [Patescibacteria group bacterium]
MGRRCVIEKSDKGGLGHLLGRMESAFGLPAMSKLLAESPEKLKLLEGLIREIRLLIAEANKGQLKGDQLADALGAFKQAMEMSPEQLQSLAGVVKQIADLIKIAEKSGLPLKELLKES